MLQLRRDLEARVLRVLLVEVVVGSWAQLGRDIGQNAREHAVNGSLFRGVSVPDCDEVRVEADREAYATELVAYTRLASNQYRRCARQESSAADDIIDSPSAKDSSSCSPIASICTCVQKSGPDVLGTRNVQLPPLMLRRSSQTGLKPDLNKYSDSRILILATGMLLL